LRTYSEHALFYSSGSHVVWIPSETVFFSILGFGYAMFGMWLSHTSIHTGGLEVSRPVFDERFQYACSPVTKI
jgi:hypothetical protein